MRGATGESIKAKGLGASRKAGWRQIAVTLTDQLSKRVNRLLSNVMRDCPAHGKNERKGWPNRDALCGSGGVWQFCRPFLPPRSVRKIDRSVLGSPEVVRAVRPI